MVARLSKTQAIHINNQAGESVYVLAMPNIAWIKADFAFTVVMAMTGPGMVEKTVVSLLNAHNLKRIAAGAFRAKDAYGIAKNYYKTLTGENDREELKKAIESSEESIKKFMKSILENAVVVKHGETIKLPEKSVFGGLVAVGSLALGYEDAKLDEKIDILDKLKYLLTALDVSDPSTFMSAIDCVADMTLVIATESMSRFTVFNTNSDHSWIVTAGEIVRAKYGTTGEHDPQEGRHMFCLNKGYELETSKNQYLSEGEAIIGWNDKNYYTMTMNKEGEAVVYEECGVQFVPKEEDNGIITWAGRINKVINFVTSPGIVIMEYIYQKSLEAIPAVIEAGFSKSCKQVWTSGKVEWQEYRTGRYTLETSPDGNASIVFKSLGSPSRRGRLPASIRSRRADRMKRSAIRLVVWSLWETTPPAAMANAVLAINSKGEPELRNRNNQALLNIADHTPFRHVPKPIDTSFLNE